MLYKLLKQKQQGQTNQQDLYPFDLVNLFKQMSFLPEISEDQHNKNVRKLIIQNKKLRQQIFVFQQQMNLILSSNFQEDKIKLSHPQLRNSSLLKKKSMINQNKLLQNHQKPFQNVDKISQQEIDKLLEANSPLIQTRIIPSFRQKVQSLKAQNIKENVNYILRQQDQLKILKKELYKWRKQKQVITQFLKDKSQKLQKSNNQLISYKNNLKEQLNNTIKFNRQSSSKITQLQRQVRKYHLTLQQYKKLSGLSSNKDLPQKDPNENFSLMLKELQDQIKKVKFEIAGIQSLWKPKIDLLDLQYYTQKEYLAKKMSQENELRKQQSFQKTRILTIKDQGSIQHQKQRQKLVKVSTKLQKQLKQYLKQQQQKLLQKQQYLKKHRPKDKDEQTYHEIITTQAKISPNPQNTQVQTQRDDKNIIKLKNYLKKKVKQDKQIQANLSLSLSFSQNQRMQRSWSNHKQLQQSNYLDFTTKKVKDQNKKQRTTPHLLLKSVKMETTFQTQIQK